MSKAVLINSCNTDAANNYVWSMCFYKIDRRSKEQPYKFHKIRFKNNDYLTSYAASLMGCINKHQISPIDSVQEYDGENTKVSCDKLSLDNELISVLWTSFVTALGKASDEKIKGKVNGYVLFGISKSDSKKTLTFIKSANPITSLINKRSVVFTATADNELEMFSDSVCRLYLNTDAMVIGNTMYTFNHNFESIFDIEKTMIKVKSKAIDQIIATNAFSDSESFKTYANQYTSNRTFVTLKEERMKRIKDKRKRKNVASMLGIELDEAGDLIIDTKEKAALLIKYICFKIFKDGETNDVLEASTISKLPIQ